VERLHRGKKEREDKKVLKEKISHGENYEKIK